MATSTPASAESLAETVESALDLVWPVGVGIEGAVRLGLATALGVDLDGRVSLTRGGARRIALCATAGLQVSLAGGIGQKLGGAFERDQAGAKAEAKGYLAGTLVGVHELGFDPDSLFDRLGGAVPGAELLPSLVDWLSPGLGLVDWSFTARGGGEVGGVVAASRLRVLVPGWGEGPLLRASAGVVAGLSGLAEVEVSFGEDDMGRVLLRTTVGALGQVSAVLDALGGWLDPADVAGLQEVAGAERSLEIGFEADAQAFEAGDWSGTVGFRLAIRQAETEDGTTVAETLEVGSLADAVRLLGSATATAGAPAVPLSELIAGLEDLSFTREVAQEVDVQRLEGLLPGWLVDFFRVEPGMGILGAESALTLGGSATADTAALQAAARAGMVAPPGALGAVVQGLLVASLGGVLPAWLAAQGAALAAGAAAVRGPEDARLSGRLAVGAGVSSSVEVGSEVKARGGGSLAILVDRPLSGPELDTLLDELGDIGVASTSGGPPGATPAVA